MTKRILLVAGLALAATVGVANAATVTLEGTLRDFSQSHQDFEVDYLNGGPQAGCVETTLSGGKPVYTGCGQSNPAANPSFAGTTTASFNQWYNDSGASNSADYDLTLSETFEGSGIYQYSSNSFFPTNDLFPGGESISGNNFHFTLELHGSIAYQNLSDSFTFTGDDDLWVFVNGKLVLDLGGVHEALTASFDGNTLAGLGIGLNESATLDIFFAERRTTQSNFTITTSLAIAPPATVPLPAGLPLLGAALLGLGALRLRRKAA